MRDHNQLRAFQLADEVVLLTYKITKSFPKEELFGISSQMRRAAVSIASNIVEGCGRNSKLEYIQFLEIAYGSHRELHYQFTVPSRLGYVDEQIHNEYEEKIIESEKVLGSLIRSIKQK
ncbi:MAG TPA: four helix bundle protein [Williamwhitmania sp.]|nr:four helix bundle protein [Williamwhitmania sp.]